jgi:hypothetical protein
VPRYRLDPVSARCPGAAAVKRRGEERASVYTIAALVTGRGLPEPLPCTVRDLSRSGARLEIDRLGIRRRVPRHARLPQDLTVYFCPSRSEVACRLSWQDGNHFGVEFTTRIDLKRMPCGRLEKAQPRVR